MAERQYKREKLRGISLGKEGLWTAQSFRIHVNIKTFHQNFNGSKCS